MAKKKNIKNSAPNNNVANSQQEEKMQSKVEIKQPERNNQEKMSRLVGSVFIGLGVLLVAFGVYSFIRFREEPSIDLDLEAPELTDVTDLTNGDKILVRGKASGFDDVFVYVNDVKIASTKVDEEDLFSYEYTVENEGDYSISVAGVKGFPGRIMGPRSEVEMAKVDWSAPKEEDVTFKYGEETNKDTFIVAGTSEPNSTVTVKRGILSYDTLADENGAYRIEGIELEEGRNVFTMSVKDLAGNEVTLEEKIRVNYSPTGDVDGDAVVDGNIPQASGELDAIFGNTLMMIFGIIAVIAFGSSSAYMYYSKRK